MFVLFILNCSPCLKKLIPCLPCSFMSSCKLLCHRQLEISVFVIEHFDGLLKTADLLLQCCIFLLQILKIKLFLAALYNGLMQLRVFLVLVLEMFL